MSDLSKFTSTTTLTSSVKRIVSGQINRFDQSSKKKTFARATIFKLIFFIALIAFYVNVNGQDSTKVKVVFQTQSDRPISLYKEISLGEINTEGFVGDQFLSQRGSFTKLDFLCNAPSTHYFERNNPVSLVITDNRSYKTRFIIDPVSTNQKWLITPPGKNYQNARLMIIWGIIGTFTSSVLFSLDAIINADRKSEYEMKLAQYNFNKNVLNNNFPPYTSGSAPQKPKTIRYTIPTIVLSCSISSIITGRILHVKNKPRAERVE